MQVQNRCYYVSYSVHKQAMTTTTETPAISGVGYTLHWCGTTWLHDLSVVSLWYLPLLLPATSIHLSITFCSALSDTRFKLDTATKGSIQQEGKIREWLIEKWHVELARGVTNSELRPSSSNLMRVFRAPLTSVKLYPSAEVHMQGTCCRTRSLLALKDRTHLKSIQVPGSQFRPLLYGTLYININYWKAFGNVCALCSSSRQIQPRIQICKHLCIL